MFCSYNTTGAMQPNFSVADSTPVVSLLHLPYVEPLVMDLIPIYACNGAILGAQYRVELRVGQMVTFAVAAAYGYAMDGTNSTPHTNPAGLSRLTLLVSNAVAMHY